jgi:hypothetical protein
MFSQDGFSISMRMSGQVAAISQEQMTEGEETRTFAFQYSFSSSGLTGIGHCSIGHRSTSVMLQKVDILVNESLLIIYIDISGSNLFRLCNFFIYIKWGVLLYLIIYLLV